MDVIVRQEAVIVRDGDDGIQAMEWAIERLKVEIELARKINMAREHDCVVQ